MASSTCKVNPSPASSVFPHLLAAVVKKLCSRDYFTLLILLAVSYSISGKLGLSFAAPNPDVTIVWFPTGIAIAAALLEGNEVWPGILIGAFWVNFATTGSVSASIGIALGNTFEALFAAYLINKFAGGVKAFFTGRGVMLFVFFGAAIPAALCASSGVFFLCRERFAAWAVFSTVWTVWWVGDFLGALLVTPFLVLLAGHRGHSMCLSEALEAAAALVGLSVVCVLNFGPPTTSWLPPAGMPYMCTPFLVWIAIRFCPLESSGATLLLAAFAIWGSLHGYGPYEHTNGVPLFVVGYIIVSSIATMTIAAVLAEYKKRAEDLLHLYYYSDDRHREEVRILQDTLDSLRRKN